MMIRRRFLGLMTLVGAGSIASLKAAGTLERRTATYKVTGFTCITCAVGLETMLKRENGILQVKATYPDGLTTITYNPHLVTEETITDAIREMGFQPAAINLS